MEVLLYLLGIIKEVFDKMDHKGKTVFNASDVCSFMGYQNELEPTWEYLKDSERLELRGPDGINDLYITESGVYKLLLRSEAAWAQQALDIICEKILPNLKA